MRTHQNVNLSALALLLMMIARALPAVAADQEPTTDTQPIDRHALAE